MASFDSDRKRSLSESDAYQKFPYKRIEPSVSKFITVLETNIDRLQKHHGKIEKFLAASDWPSLHSEQVNASRTVQQINATVREMERARNQLNEDDTPKFDAKVAEVKRAAVAAVVAFMDNCGNSDKPAAGPAVLPVTHQSETTAGSYDGQTSPLISSSSDQQTAPLRVGSQQTYVIPEDSQAAESWEQLKDSLMELNTLVHEFSAMVHDQQEKVDNIEDNINRAHCNVQQGVFNLSKAAKLKAAVYPLTGALIGGVVGGPVGIFAGLKLGGLAAVSGGVVGLVGGRFIRKHQEKVQETELNNLSMRNNSKDESTDSSLKSP